MNNTDYEKIESELTVLFRLITSISNDNKNGPLERSAYLLLRQISSYGMRNVKALAEDLKLDISTVSRQISALELKQYVTRMPDPQDGRSFSLQMTDSGTDVLLEHKKARLSRVEKVFSNWSEDECQQFGVLLKKFNDSIMDHQK